VLLRRPVRQAVPWMRQLVAGFPQRRPGGEPKSDNVGFVVNKVTLRQVLSEYFRFPCQISFHGLLHAHHHHPGLIPRRNSDRRTKWTQSHPTCGTPPPQSLFAEQAGLNGNTSQLCSVGTLFESRSGHRFRLRFLVVFFSYSGQMPG
jgi:hypothetical protein